MASGATGGKPGGKALANCNYVAQDQIWKGHVTQEEAAAKIWPSNWNFLTGSHRDLVKDEFPQARKGKREIPTLIQIRPVTPIEEYIKVQPSPRPFPSTTSQQIGWRSTRTEHKLEKYGKYAKPKGGLVKQLNWPQEAVD
ncbi:uncharacterized protein C20orf85 homolog isoform X1 [Haliotis rubra]|uniref:uncharacterized protein C20orf85 homolog isoform X1 n=1 Tax=Haliotis rubra TaxID=36100 RepID=UPI001EE633F8|nr:uncharacterized protein C20orf85 homolog isoform X1 [Haliotis rubra]